MRWLLALLLIICITFPIGYLWYGGDSTSAVFDAATDRSSGSADGSTHSDASRPEGTDRSPVAQGSAEHAAPASENGPTSAIAESDRPNPQPSGEAVNTAAEADQAVQTAAPNPSSVAAASEPPQPEAAAVALDPSPSGEAVTAAAPNEPPQPETAAVEPVEPAAEAKTWVIVTGSRVNVRKDPSRTGQWVTSYVRDTKLQLLERSENWIRIRHPETNETGWMYAEFLRDLPPENA